MKVILLGPPGAGKGTQAARIADELDVTHAASGDLFRNNIRNETELGLQVKSYLDGGVLVPDDLTIRLMMSWISHRHQAQILAVDSASLSSPLQTASFIPLRSAAFRPSTQA